MLDTAIVIPWRPTSYAREAALDIVLDSLHSALPQSPVYLSDSGDSCFSRAGSRNKGVQEAARDGYTQVVVNDADTLCEIDSLYEAIDSCCDGVLHLPYTQCITLEEEGTSQQVWNNSVGGVLVISIDAWNKTGGQNTRFVGWGFEDVAFWTAANAILGMTIRHEGVIKCLWHPRDFQTRTNHLKSRNLLKQYLNSKNNKQTILDLQGVH